MISKTLFPIGIIACIALIVSCFLPWAYYADSHIVNEADRTFTGFYSYQHQYGRPGMFLVFSGVIILVLMIVPKIWAKRTNLFLSALVLAYAIKSYVLFTSCYNAYCPEKRMGIYIMIVASVFILAASVFPKMKLENNARK